MNLTVDEATLVLAVLKNLSYKLSPDLVVIQNAVQKLEVFVNPKDTRQPNVQEGEVIKEESAHGPTNN